MSEDVDSDADADVDGEEGGPAGMLLSVAMLDLLLLGTALYAFRLGESFAGGVILAVALILTGIDVWLYRRGSF